jgi:hypothetical protein
MAPLLSANGIGLYFVEEENGQIAANTPGGIDLGNLTLGDTYIYFDTVLRFEHKLTFNKESDNFIGFWTWGSGNNTVATGTGGASRGYFMITVECDETTVENLEKLTKLNVVAGDGLKYLVKQTASAVFRQFPNSSAALKNYAPIVVRGVDAVEIDTSGKDVQIVNIACEEITTRS